MDPKKDEAKDAKVGAAEIVAALSALNVTAKATGEMVAKLETRIDGLGGAHVAAPVVAPVVTQTETQAKAAFDGSLRDQYEVAKSDAERKAIVDRMEAHIRQRDAEAEEIRRSIDFRKSSMSMGDMAAKIEEAAGVVKAETARFWNQLSSKAQSGSLWVAEFEGMKPYEVLIRGAQAVVNKSWQIDRGAVINVPTLSGLTAGSDDALLREAQDANDLLFTWMKWKQGRQEHFQSIESSPYYARYAKAIQELGRGLYGKAFTSTTITNWIPTGFSAQIWERFEGQRNLLKFLEFFQMPQNPYDMPVRGTYLTPVKTSQTTTNPESATGITTTNPQTLKTTLSLHEWAFRAAFSFGAEEDSLPAIVPALMQDLASSKAKWLEEFVLNSDSVSPHKDTDITGGTDIRDATVDGLRITAVRNSWTTSLSAADSHTAEAIETGTGAMGKYSDPAGLVYVCGYRERAKIKVLKNSSGHPVVIGSANPMNPSAMESKGSIDTLNGSPLVTSEAMRENIGANGHYDGTTTNSWTLLAYARRAFVLAAKNQQGRFEADTAVHSAQRQMLQYERWEFEDAIPTSGMTATEHSVHAWIGITTTS